MGRLFLFAYVDQDLNDKIRDRNNQRQYLKIRHPYRPPLRKHKARAFSKRSHPHFHFVRAKPSTVIWQHPNRFPRFTLILPDSINFDNILTPKKIQPPPSVLRQGLIYTIQERSKFILRQSLRIEAREQPPRRSLPVGSRSYLLSHAANGVLLPPNIALPGSYAPTR